MIYQITAPKEANKPIIKESLKRSNIKYLGIFNIAAFIFWTIIIFSCIFDGSLISHLSREMYDNYGLFMSAQLVQFYIFFIFLLYLLFFSIFMLISFFINSIANKKYPYLKFDIDLKNETVKVGNKKSLKKISWHRSFIYDDHTIVLKLKSDIHKAKTIIIFKNEGITEEDYNYLITKITKG